MDDLLERIPEILAEIPVGLIIFLIAILFSFFGRNPERQAQEREGHAPTRQPAPRPAAPSNDPYARPREERPQRGTFDRSRKERPSGEYTFASDERRAREERDRAGQDVLVFGGLDFGRRGSLFDEEASRDSQWGKTKYGFDESEWGSTFGDRKNPDPIIR